MPSEIIAPVLDHLTLSSMGSVAGKGLLILSLGALAGLAARRYSAAVKHWIYLVTLLLAGAVPLFVAAIPSWKALPRFSYQERPVTHQKDGYWITPPYIGDPISLSQPAADEATDRQTSTGTAPTPSHRIPPSSSVPSSSIPTPGLSLPIILAGIWVGGATICLMLLGMGFISLRSIRHRSEPLESGELFQRIQLSAEDFGIKLPISVYLKDSGSMPMIWALRKGHLFLPRDILGWSPDRQKIIVTHELAHLKRRDTWSVLAGFISASIHWFNPLSWILFRALRNQQEMACDDLVLAREVTPSTYAEQILELSAASGVPAVYSPASGMARPCSLQERIMSILDSSRQRAIPTRRSLASCITLATAIVIPVAALTAAEALIKTGRGRILDRNGIVLAEDIAEGRRHYPHGRLAAHHIGICLKTDSDILRKGRMGVEELFEKELDARNDVTTTLDLRIQQAMDSIFREAKIEKGAAILMDPVHGDILASISLPDTDLNNPNSDLVKAFTERSESRRFALTDRIYSISLQDRNYAPRQPGTLYQLIPALSASQKGMFGNKHECVAPPVTNKTPQCWVSGVRESTPGRWLHVPWHGLQDAETAMKNSCWSYFKQLSWSVGFNDLEKTSLLVLPVESSLHSWNRYRLRPSFSSLTTSTAGELRYGADQHSSSESLTNATMGVSGQSRAAPIHLVTLMSAISNGGKLLHPRYSMAIPPQVRENLLRENISFKPVKKEDLEAIRRGMERGMTELHNESYPAQSEKISIVGKASLVRSKEIVSAYAADPSDGRKPSFSKHARKDGSNFNLSWFIGYTPADNPKYAIAVMIEDPKSADQNSAALARRILEQVSSTSQGKDR